MKKIIFSLAGILVSLLYSYGQNLAINTDGSAADANAILDIKSNNKGILIPRMSSAARLSIAPTKGLLVYDSTTQSFWYNTGVQWKSIASSEALSGGGAWLLTGNSGIDTSNFLGTIDDRILNFRVSNTPSGRIDQFRGNTFFGYKTGLGFGDGEENTAIGQEALANNTDGTFNTAAGYQSMAHNTTGYE